MKTFKKLLLVSLFFVIDCKIWPLQGEKMNKEFKSKTEINDVFFHFIHAIIDEDTYNAIKESNFLKNEFCNGQEKTHTGESSDHAKTSWTGFYLTGENTYIQIFNSKDQNSLKKLNVGRIGIEFMVEQKEDLEKITKNFKQKFTNNLSHGIFKKNIDNIQVPWFYYLDDSSMMPELDTMIMAYLNDYLKFKNIEPHAKDSITRKEYNKTCNAVPFDKEKLFKDIEEITLLLNNENKRKFVERLTLLNYICEEAENYVICRGPGITFKLNEFNEQTCRLLKLQMSLNHKINDPLLYKLGNSTINLKDYTAIWTF